MDTDTYSARAREAEIGDTMEVAVEIEGTKATIKPTDKITVQTAPDLEEAISSLDEAVCDYDIDLSEVEYISSAGLRVLVNTQKVAMQKGGTMTLIDVAPDVKEVLDMTGLSDVFVLVER